LGHRGWHTCEENGIAMWLGERGSLAFKIGGDGKEVHLRQKRKQAYPERKSSPHVCHPERGVVAKPT